MVAASIDLAKAMNTVGLMNVQFVIHEDTAYVIEVNPRASRTVPFISKVTHLKLAQLATRVMLGERLADMGFETGSSLSLRRFTSRPQSSHSRSCQMLTHCLDQK